MYYHVRGPFNYVTRPLHLGALASLVNVVYCSSDRVLDTLFLLVVQAVDYWSLGVTVFKLLTGSRPFDRRQFQAFLDDARCRMGMDHAKYDVRLKHRRNVRCCCAYWTQLYHAMLSRETRDPCIYGIQ